MKRQINLYIDVENYEELRRRNINMSELANIFFQQLAMSGGKGRSEAQRALIKIQRKRGDLTDELTRLDMEQRRLYTVLAEEITTEVNRQRIDRQMKKTIKATKLVEEV